MSIDLVSSTDPRFPELNRGRASGLFPTPQESAAAIALCPTADDVAQALEQTLHAGKRPTILSGGHCYEGFVFNNPGGTIIDVRPMAGVTQDPTTKRWKIESGATVSEMYLAMYNAGYTIPAISCTNTVGVGGSISGGAYGYMSRLMGIAPDWVTAVDILTVDAKGKVQLRHADKSNDPDLLRACRGSGGGQYGIVTAFYCDTLPAAPKEKLSGRVSFDWGNMTPERLYRILYLYSNYFDTRGRDPDTWGLFTILDLSPVDPARPGRFGMSLEFCNPDGTAQDTKVLDEFFAVFDECKPVSELAHHPSMPGADHRPDPSGPGEIVCLATHNAMLRPFSNSIGIAQRPANAPGGPSAARVPASGPPRLPRKQKYKSAYMRKPYTKEEAAVLFKYMTDGNQYGRGVSVAMDSFGGAASKPGLLESTSDAHRDSIIKMQFITGWTDAADDKPRAEWFDRFYTDLWSASSNGKHSGTPYFSDRHEGCYINYPDSDMLKYSYWPQLYWGNGKLYPFLQHVKKKYDPSNVFHHSMSVRA